MNDLENYKSILENIFKGKKINFETNLSYTNNIIGALNNPENFSIFKNNFLARLNRLYNAYKQSPKQLERLFIKANLVAHNNNYEGAYAELVALDYLNDSDFVTAPFDIDVDLNKKDTFAYELGKKAVDIDSYTKDYDVYFEFKSFKDIVNELFQGIFSEVTNLLKIKRSDLVISASYPIDMPFYKIKNNRKAIIKEIENEIVLRNKPTRIKSNIIKNTSFNLLWGKGILTSEQSFNAYRYAKNYHGIIFNYIGKFVKKKPFVIIFVVFPWFNGVINKFNSENKKFYRAFSRRIFCQYKYPSRKVKLCNDKFDGAQTMYRITKYLSAIIFLEDISIKRNISNQKKNRLNINSYIYINPNATNPLKRIRGEELLLYNNTNNIEFENFEDDNY